MEHFGPAQCSACQRILLDHHVIERRQVLERPVLRAQVIEHRRMRSICTCGAVHGGVFPVDVTAPVQAGFHPRGRRSTPAHLPANSPGDTSRACGSRADETGIRIQGKLEWLHCAVTPSLSYLQHHPKRGMLAMEAIGIGAPFKGTLVHDGLQSYKQLDCAHSLLPSLTLRFELGLEGSSYNCLCQIGCLRNSHGRKQLLIE